jgi:single-strand DNA-binding protein
VPADLNRVTLIGRLTRDPELRHTASGDPLCNMRIAVNSRARDESGNWGDRPNFFDVVVFGRQAESVAQYMSKGRRIGVDGSLSWREWESQDGGKRQTVEVRARDIFFLDSRGDGDGGGGHQQGGGWSSPAPASGASADVPVDTSDMRGSSTPDDDDIPF